MARATKGQINRRVFAVYSWLMAGVDRAEIVRRGSEKWKVGERQIEDYLTLAHKMIQAYTNRSAEEIRSHHVAMRYSMIRKALEPLKGKTKDRGRIDLAHTILKDLDELLGQYPAGKIDLSSAGKPVKFLSITNPSSAEKPK